MILGSRLPRVFTPELRELTPETSLGFEAVEMWRSVFGMELMPHQEELFIRSLELAPGSSTRDEFPKLRFSNVLVLMARQNGKTYTLTARALWRMLMWEGPGQRPGEGPVILGLAHKLQPAEEILEKGIGVLRACEHTRPLIAQRSNTNGNKFVRLANGSKWLTQAANDDAGRSESVTDLFFDELRQQRDWDAWTAAENTTNSIFSSQVWGVSNAGEAKSVVLKGMRSKAISAADSLRDWISEHGSVEGWGGDTSLGIFEWSAPEGAPIDDVEALAQANPAMNREANDRILVTSEALLAKAAKVGTNDEDGIPEHKFRTEVMCQFVTVSAEPTFPPDQVEACTDKASSIVADSELVYAVDVSADRKTGWVGVAGWRDDERVHLEVIAKRAGTHWIRDFLNNLATPGPVVIQGRGAPASSLITWLRQDGVNVQRCEGSELTNALSQLDDALAEGTVRFRPQDALLLAMRDTVRRRAGEVTLLDRGESPVDASPLAAVMLARWGLMNLDAEEQRVTAYGDDYGEWYESATDSEGSDERDGAEDEEDWRWWA